MINIIRYNRVFRLFRRIGYSIGIQKIIGVNCLLDYQLIGFISISSLIDAILHLDPDSLEA